MHSSRRSRRGVDDETVALYIFTAAVVIIVLLTALFFWYVFDGLPRTYPTNHNNFLYGLVQGYYVVVTFIISLFNHKVTIYQTPNTGVSYNLGFVLGITSGTGTVITRSWVRRRYGRR